MCAAHTETLMRSRSGSRVLEGVLAVFHPANVVEATARVLAGLHPLAVESGEFEEGEGIDEEGEEDGEGYDEEDGEGYDEDGEEGDYEEEGEEGDCEEEGEGAEEEEVDEEVLAEMEASHQTDKRKQSSSAPTMAAPQATVEEAREVLPIAEDPVAHQFLKRVMLFEAAAEAKLGLVAGKAKKLLKDADFVKLAQGNDKKGEVAVEDELWIDQYAPSGTDDGASTSVAHRLIELLGEDEETALAWLGQNRPCFALVKVFSVPTMVGELGSFLNKARLTALKAAAEKQEGAKLLLQLHEVVKKCK
jgi:hypothetical protein